MTTRRGELLPLWHYTTLEYLDAIAHSGEVRPTACLDRATGRTQTLTMQEMYAECGLAGIGVHPSNAQLIRWDAFVRSSGIHPSTARAMAYRGTPRRWFASYTPVPEAEWVAVETWSGEAWLPVPAEHLRRVLAGQC
jgi:hypothetical protein